MRMLAVFEKGVRLRHIGHLDIQRAMQRALRRSGLPVAYSKGFHPHILISFASALSTGAAGKREIMDVQMEQSVSSENFIALLNHALPPDMQISFAKEIEDNHPALMSLLQAAEYTMKPFDQDLLSGAINRFSDFLHQDVIMTEKKTKRSTSLVNIRPLIEKLSADENGIHAVLSLTQEESCKPSMLLSALQAFLEGEQEQKEPRALVVRKQLYGKDGSGTLVPLEQL